jgi:hypothetical protein
MEMKTVRWVKYLLEAMFPGVKTRANTKHGPYTQVRYVYIFISQTTLLLLQLQSTVSTGIATHCVTTVYMPIYVMFQKIYM